MQPPRGVTLREPHGIPWKKTRPRRRLAESGEGRRWGLMPSQWQFRPKGNAWGSERSARKELTRERAKEIPGSCDDGEGRKGLGR